MTPVIFVTCLKELQDRLTGYEAGGDGYIAKPFDIKELRLIVHSHVTKKLQADEGKQHMDSLQMMSWTMMKNQSEMGELLRFSSGISKVKDEAAFVDHIFSTLTNFGLKVTLLVKLLSGEVVARNDGQPFTLIEKELLDLAQNGDRITAHGAKYIFKGDSLMLLVKNMPIDDEELIGRLRDHLCILLDSAEASIEIINAEKRREQAEKNRTRFTLGTVQREFDQITHVSEQIHKQSTASVENLSGALESALMLMDLTEEQEHQILGFIETARLEIEKQSHLKDQFHASMEKIVLAIDQQAETA